MADLALLRSACTEKEARCAEAYVRSGNYSEAAREAGYKGGPSTMSRTGRKVMARAHVWQYAEALRKETFGDPKTLLEQVRDRLAHIGFGEHVEQPVGRGGKLKARPAAVASQVKALETLARMLGGLDPRVRVELEPQIDAYLEGLRRRISPEAFEEVLEALAALKHDEADD